MAVSHLPNGNLIETKTFTKTNKNKKPYEVHYFIKPDCYRYGYGITNRQIFSTTEQLTSFLIERHIGTENLFVPVLMPDIKMYAGDITVFKTKLTGRNKDGLLLPITRRAQKEGHDFYLIGDGISPINHTNNKGQNCFDDKDCVVELSQMNLLDIPLWLDELGWTENDLRSLKLVDALDRMHQAIGRNSGYRHTDKNDEDRKQVVVLIDGGLYKDVIQLSRYHIGRTEDLDNGDVNLIHKRERTTLADCLAWYIQNMDTYVTASHIKKGDRKMFERDCKWVIDNCDQKFIDRMKLAVDYWVNSKLIPPKTKTALIRVTKQLFDKIA